MQQRLHAADPGLQIVHPDAAGIDVGNKSHFVAVPEGRDAQPVQEFGSWTAELKRMAEWLKSCGIRTVAMQSTGVYWIAVQEVLEQEGIEVYLVNARGTKNLPGRKSDVQECQWLKKLHTYGLLRNSFRPPEQIRAVRTVWRQRDRLVRDAGRSIQQMQKALTTMNVQLSNAISDISGVTGLAIIRAILQGRRDPWELAKLRDRRIQASEEEVARSLEGHWREDVLFELGQVVEGYDFCQQQIAACDKQLEKYLAVLPECVRAAKGEGAPAPGGEAKKKRCQSKPRRKNQPGFNLEAELHRILGVNLTRIDGIDIMTAQVILSELGSDLSAFPSEAAFCSWLELAPRRDITGGKVIKQKSRESKNRVANALRMGAESLWHSDSYLGARYRRFRGRMDGKKAVKAMARYLACLIYRLLTRGQDYIDRGAAYFENKRTLREMVNLKRKAAELGMKLLPAS
ncbi:MAG: IS110 family transposase [Acidobacteriia bacterium]|nr:IS110 family transposase [Terriglobia bacterium]